MRVGDGWHGGFVTPERVTPIVAQLRAERPEADFVISMRTSWDPLLDEGDRIVSELYDHARAGVNHVVAEPRRRDPDDYLRAIEGLAALCERAGVELRA